MFTTIAGGENTIKPLNDKMELLFVKMSLIWLVFCIYFIDDDDSWKKSTEQEKMLSLVRAVGNAA